MFITYEYLRSFALEFVWKLMRSSSLFPRHNLIPAFVRIQLRINQYNRSLTDNEQHKQHKSFMVIPQFQFHRHHVPIDTKTLIWVHNLPLEENKNKMSLHGGKISENKKEPWRSAFGFPKFKKRTQKEFAHFCESDGYSISFLF